MYFYIKPDLVTINRKKYFEFDGLVYPSVTSILSATKSKEFKQSLSKWRQRIGSDRARQITANASRRGISLHGSIEKYLLKRELPLDFNENQYWQSIHPVLDKIDRVHLVESAVYNLEHKYAGCFDCLGEWNGQLCLFDWKTSFQPKKIEWIVDYCLQISAYIAAIENLYRVKVERGIIAIALLDKPAQIFYLNAEDLEEYWKQFLDRLKLWEELNAAKKSSKFLKEKF